MASISMSAAGDYVCSLGNGNSCTECDSCGKEMQWLSCWSGISTLVENVDSVSLTLCMII